FFFFNHPPTSDIYTLSLHDALPISNLPLVGFTVHDGPEQRLHVVVGAAERAGQPREHRGEDGFFLRPHVVDRLVKRLTHELAPRSEEHTSELQSRENLVCRLLLEKK